MMTDPLDLAAITEKWLGQCASCDAGLLAGCTCPQEDHRPVILSLVREVERLRVHLRAKTAAVGVALQFVPRGVCEVCGEPTDTPPECRDCFQRADDAAVRRADQ